MRDLTITGVQCDLKWEDKSHNLSHIDKLLSEAAPVTDVIILPEMFSTGFSMNAKSLSESMEGPVVQWMSEMMDKHNAAICGSLIIEEEGKYYNRFVWMDGRQVKTYNKRHLFSLLGEGDHYSAGNENIVIEFKDWIIQPFICYDLRFPAWNRNTMNAGLQLFVANWPERRIAHWVALLKARAIENQCYVAGVNRVGNDYNGIHHTGDSGIFDPYGYELTSFREEEKVFTQKLSYEGLKKCRDKFPFLNDRDNFTFK